VIAGLETTLDDVAVEVDGGIADLALHGQHPAATLLQVGQEAFLFLLAHLLEEVLQFLLGLLQLGDGLALFAGGVILLVLLDVHLGLLHVFLGIVQQLLHWVLFLRLISLALAGLAFTALGRPLSAWGLRAARALARLAGLVVALFFVPGRAFAAGHQFSGVE